MENVRSETQAGYFLPGQLAGMTPFIGYARYGALKIVSRFYHSTLLSCPQYYVIPTLTKGDQGRFSYRPVPYYFPSSVIPAVSGRNLFPRHARLRHQASILAFSG